MKTDDVLDKKIKQGKSNALLIYYNSLLKEHFSIQEPPTKKNLSLVKHIKSICDINEINYRDFIEDLISNFNLKYGYLTPRFINYPALGFISKEVLRYISEYKKEKHTEDGQEVIYV